MLTDGRTDEHLLEFRLINSSGAFGSGELKIEYVFTKISSGHVAVWQRQRQITKQQIRYTKKNRLRTVSKKIEVSYHRYGFDVKGFMARHAHSPFIFMHIWYCHLPR